MLQCLSMSLPYYLLVFIPFCFHSLESRDSCDAPLTLHSDEMNEEGEGGRGGGNKVKITEYVKMQREKPTKNKEGGGMGGESAFNPKGTKKECAQEKKFGGVGEVGGATKISFFFQHLHKNKILLLVIYRSAGDTNRNIYCTDSTHLHKTDFKFLSFTRMSSTQYLPYIQRHKLD